MKEQKNILITGGRSPATLYLTRLFGKAGHKVFIAESIKRNLAGSSKYVVKNIKVPEPAFSHERFTDYLIQIIKENKIDILIPTCEEVYYISKDKDKLDKYCFVFTDSIETLTTLHSKFSFINLLGDLNINYPESKLIKSKSELKQELISFGDFVLKPEYSRFAANVIINDQSHETMEKINISGSYPWVLQKFIKGKHFCSYTIAQEGKIKAHSVYPSNYTTGIGATVYFESVNIPEIFEIVKKIVEHFNYTGQIAFDFIYSDDDNVYYPIECNPRSTSGICLFSEYDNLPLSFQKDIKLNNIIFSGSRNKTMYLIAMIIYYLPKIRNLKDLSKITREIISAKDVIFNIDDPIPFFEQFITIFYYYFESLRKDITILEASTVDIEWNGKWE